MLLIVHILLALASIAFSTFTLVTPSTKKINITYVLTLGMLVSAGLLVVVNHAPLGHTCLTGLAYLGLVAVNIFFSKRRLAATTS